MQRYWIWPSIPPFRGLRRCCSLLSAVITGYNRLAFFWTESRFGKASFETSLLLQYFPFYAFSSMFSKHFFTYFTLFRILFQCSSCTCVCVCRCKQEEVEEKSAQSPKGTVMLYRWATGTVPRLMTHSLTYTIDILIETRSSSLCSQIRIWHTHSCLASYLSLRCGDHVLLSGGPLVARTGLCSQYEVTAIHPLGEGEWGLHRRAQGLSLPLQQQVHMRTKMQDMFQSMYEASLDVSECQWISVSEWMSDECHWVSHSLISPVLFP